MIKDPKATLLNKCKILVIEDDPEISETLRDVLEDEGYDVSVALNGQEAMDLMLLIAPPKLIFLDFNMPVMNGGDFFKLLRANPAWEKIPVIVTSSERISDLTAIFKETQHIISKPYTLEAVLNAAKAICS